MMINELQLMVNMARFQMGGWSVIIGIIRINYCRTMPRLKQASTLLAQSPGKNIGIGRFSKR